jgi:hypothetical protein
LYISVEARRVKVATLSVPPTAYRQVRAVLVTQGALAAPNRGQVSNIYGTHVRIPEITAAVVETSQIAGGFDAARPKIAILVVSVSTPLVLW